MKKEIGRVTEEERDEIQRLFEHRNGLNELEMILTADNAELYQRLTEDIAATKSRFGQWWSTMASKYGWESTDGGNWEIDFKNCTVYLVTKE